MFAACLRLEVSQVIQLIVERHGLSGVRLRGISLKLLVTWPTHLYGAYAFHDEELEPNSTCLKAHMAPRYNPRSSRVSLTPAFVGLIFAVRTTLVPCTFTATRPGADARRPRIRCRTFGFHLCHLRGDGAEPLLPQGKGFFRGETAIQLNPAKAPVARAPPGPVLHASCEPTEGLRLAPPVKIGKTVQIKSNCEGMLKLTGSTASPI